MQKEIIGQQNSYQTIASVHSSMQPNFVVLIGIIMMYLLCVSVRIVISITLKPLVLTLYTSPFVFHTAPDDYEPLINASVTYQVGDPIGTILCLNVDIYDDEVVEYVEDLSVVLSAFNEPVYFDPMEQANISIFDNDCKLFYNINLTV